MVSHGIRASADALSGVATSSKPRRSALIAGHANLP